MIRRLHRTSRRQLEERIDELLEHNRVRARTITRHLDTLEGIDAELRAINPYDHGDEIRERLEGIIPRALARVHGQRPDQPKENRS